MKEITDKEFYQLRDYIKDNYGINLSDDRKSLVFSRLRTTLIDLGMDNFTQYYNYLVNDKTKQSLIRFIDKVTTNHTFFMREVDHFDYLRDVALPYVEETWGAQKDLRLWCAACSSGEESNTLQMIAYDHFRGKNWNMQILATDISTQVLDKAVWSVYPNDSLASVPDRWRKEYFVRYDDSNSQVVDEIKKMIIYRKFNLMEKTLPFKKKFQIIFCRNVMIYFDNETRDEIVQRFYDAIEDGGFLFIGHSESLSHTATRFKYVKPALYRKL